MTSAPRSSVRRPARSSGSSRRRTRVATCSVRASAAATSPDPVATERPEVTASATASGTASGRACGASSPASSSPVGVQHRHRAVEDAGEHLGHLGHASAADEQVGEPVVGQRGGVDGLGVPGEGAVGLVELDEQAGVLQRHHRVGREGGEQADLRLREAAHGPVHREEGTDHHAVEDQRHAEDGADLLTGHRLVDVALVHEPLVRGVVLGEVGRARLGDQAQQAGAERQPQGLELAGQRSVGDLHVGRAVALVVEREVGHVAVQELTRAAHDRREDGVDVADRGEVGGGLVERGELGLPGAHPAHQVAQPHRHVVLRAHHGRIGLAQARLALREVLVEGGQRRLVVEQVQEGRHVAHPAPSGCCGTQPSREMSISRSP